MKCDKEHRYIVVASDFMPYGRFEVQKVVGPFDHEEAADVATDIVMKHAQHERAQVYPLGEVGFEVHTPSEEWLEHEKESDPDYTPF